MKNSEIKSGSHKENQESNIPKINVISIDSSDSNSQTIKKNRKRSVNAEDSYRAGITIKIEKFNQKDESKSSLLLNKPHTTKGSKPKKVQALAPAKNLDENEDFVDEDFTDNDLLIRQPTNQFADFEDMKEQLLPMLHLESIKEMAEQKVQESIKIMEEFTNTEVAKLKEELLSKLDEQKNLITEQCKDYSHSEDIVLEATLRSYIDNGFQIALDQLKEMKIETQSKFDITNEYINHKDQDIMNFVKEEIKRRNRGHSDMMMVIDVIKNKNITIMKEFNEIETGIFNIAEIVSAIIELLSINNVLSTQDEIDKDSISLWGMQEKFTNQKMKISKTIDNSNHTIKERSIERPSTSINKYNVVSIDKNCLSCSGANPFVVSAFKMACLAYHPSNVEFKRRIFKRLDLHKLKSEILNNVYLEFKDLHPWNDSRCKSNAFTPQLSFGLLETAQNVNIQTEEIQNKTVVHNSDIQISPLSKHDMPRPINKYGEPKHLKRFLKNHPKHHSISMKSKIIKTTKSDFLNKRNNQQESSVDILNEYESVESKKGFRRSKKKGSLNPHNTSSENSKSFNHFSTFLNSKIVYTNRINDSKLINFKTQGRLLTAYSKIRENRERLKSGKQSSRNKSEQTSVISSEGLSKCTPNMKLS